MILAKLPRLSSASIATHFLIAATLTACGGGGTDAPNPPAPPLQLADKPITLASGLRYGWQLWPEGSSSTGGSGQPVDNVNCLVTEDYHIHAHLAILRDGQPMAIPSHIGLKGCAYELHTHDLSGVIHVETSAYRPFTLGQFFSIWGQPLQRDNIAGLTGMPVVIYINDGAGLTEYTGDLASLELKAHREITIQMGSAPAAIPSYTWGAGL